MTQSLNQRLRPLAPGIVLALLAIGFGFGLGAAFGAVEDVLKGGLRSSAEAVLDSTYGGDTAELDKVVSKSWSYYKRSHLHANALGTAALACILLLAALGQAGAIERVAAWSFGLGAVLYGVFWLLAGTIAPGLGSTSAAKEGLWFVAIPGSSLCMLGLGLTGIQTLRRLFLSSE